MKLDCLCAYLGSFHQNKSGALSRIDYFGVEMDSKLSTMESDVDAMNKIRECREGLIVLGSKQKKLFKLLKKGSNQLKAQRLRMASSTEADKENDVFSEYQPLKKVKHDDASTSPVKWPEPELEKLHESRSPLRPPCEPQPHAPSTPTTTTSQQHHTSPEPRVNEVVEAILHEMVGEVSSRESQSDTLLDLLNQLSAANLVSAHVQEAAKAMRLEVEELKQFMEAEKEVLIEQHNNELVSLADKEEELRSELALCESGSTMVLSCFFHMTRSIAAARCMEDKAEADRKTEQVTAEREERDRTIEELKVSEDTGPVSVMTWR